MTDSSQAHKDDAAIRVTWAKRVRCVPRLWTDCTALMSVVSVSCLHTTWIFWNSYQETEITTISQRMQVAMSSNSFAIVKLATAKLKMKMLPAGFPVALCSTAIQSRDRHSIRSFWFCRWRCWCCGCIGIRVCSVSAMWASCIFRQCLNASASSCNCRRSFWSPSAFKRRTQCLAFWNSSGRVAVQSCLSRAMRSKSIKSFLSNIMLRQWLSVSFLFVPPWKYRRMVAMFSLSCFLLHLLRPVEHDLSFRWAVLCSSTGILLNDQARDWRIVAISLLGCCRTPLVLQISPATAINDPDFRKGIAMRTLKFCRILTKFEDLCGSCRRVVVVIPRWTFWSRAFDSCL